MGSRVLALLSLLTASLLLPCATLSLLPRALWSCSTTSRSLGAISPTTSTLLMA